MTETETRAAAPLGVMERLHGLHSVAWRTPEEISEQLDELGADVNEAMEGGLRPLHLAAITPLPAGTRAITALIEAGADPNEVDDMQAPPAFWAARWGVQAGLAELVIRTDQAFSRLDAWGRNIAHWWACGADERGAGSEALLDPDEVDWEQHDELGANPIHWAAAMPGRVARLVQLEPEHVIAPDRRGFLPIHWAAVCGQIETCRQLARLGHEKLGTDATRPVGDITIRDLLPGELKGQWDDEPPHEAAGPEMAP